MFFFNIEKNLVLTTEKIFGLSIKNEDTFIRTFFKWHSKNFIYRITFMPVYVSKHLFTFSWFSAPLFDTKY